MDLADDKHKVSSKNRRCAYCKQTIAFPFSSHERNAYCSLGCFEMAGMLDASSKPEKTCRCKITRVSILEHRDGKWKADVTVGTIDQPNYYVSFGDTPDDALAALHKVVAEGEDGWTWAECDSLYFTP